MKIAIIGATGLVGSIILKIIEERNINISEIIPVASQKSVGNKKVLFNNNEIVTVSIENAISQKPDFALFSAGGEVSKQFAERFAEQGTIVIDNSSAWRMDNSKRLIVPELNGNILTEKDMIIANPNCSTIQMVMVLAPLHTKYSIKRLVISTYQSVSGTGVKALQQLDNEKNNIKGEQIYPHPIYKNCLPHCDIFMESGYTKEEEKLIFETNKILDSNINITATAVRVPVSGGHSESVNIEFGEDFDIQEVRKILSASSGITLQDNPTKAEYPMPLFSEGKDDVFVGRIRRDNSQKNSLNLWITADNLRKGAALNAVQIMELILSKDNQSCI